MEPSKFIESLQYFFNEILGFLLPGLIFVILFVFFIEPPFGDLNYDLLSKNYWVTAIFCYVLGYLIFGWSLFKKALQRKIFDWIREIILKKELDEGKELTHKKEPAEGKELVMARKLMTEVIPGFDTQMSSHDIRSLALSYVPESNQKVYTFKFREDLFERWEDTVWLFVLWGTLSYFVSFINCSHSDMFFDQNKTYLIPILFLLVFPLNAGKKRYEKIAFKLPFFLFIAKFNKLKPE